MNIVTPYPTNIPVNTANVTTEQARRDSQLRDLITKPSPTEPGVAERGLSAEHDKSKPNQQHSNQSEVSNKQTADHARINSQNREGRESADREGGEPQDQSNRQDQQAESKRQARSQELAESKQRLAAVEEKLAQLDLKEIRELKSRDAEVRAHEQAHAVVGGQYTGSPTYTYERGPDNRSYAVGGEVQIDIAPIPGDPQATVEKMKQVRAAALAPAEPSSQDRKVAAAASQAINKALADQVRRQNEEAAEANLSSESVETDPLDPSATQNSSKDPIVSGILQQESDSLEPVANQSTATLAETKAQPSVASVFADPQQLAANRDAAQARNDQRATQVLERAGRVQSFYATATQPRVVGFSQFA